MPDDLPTPLAPPGPPAPDPVEHAPSGDQDPLDPSSEPALAGSAPRGAAPLLLATVFVVAICGLIYELLFGTLSTYLLGSSVTQFSLVIGLFLTAMGIGSFLSRFLRRNLLSTFLIVEILVGLIGGFSALLLFFAFAALRTYLPLLVGITLTVGTLVGLEIPLVVRILRAQASLRVALGNVLALDYLGAFAASLLFPLLLVPHLGMIRTGLLFGLLNVAVSILGIWLFRRQLPGVRRLAALAGLSLLALGAGFAGASRATALLEDLIYDDPVVLARTTPYQRLVLTRWRSDLRLYIDGNLQFSSADEFRYHEALVHPALSLAGCPREVLLLGAGDGLAAREILKHRCVQRIDLVDLDPEMTRLFSEVALLRELNRGALRDRRVRIVNQDAQKFLEQSAHRYAAILIDLPDPNNEGLGKLYSRSFYRLVGQHLAEGGVMVTQATSPFYATDAFWCIVNTIDATTLRRGSAERLHALPYHASVPSFGEWGFVLAARRPLRPEAIRIEVPTRYLSSALVPTLFVFGADIARRATPVNQLDNQVLVRLYEAGFRRYNR